MSIRDRQDDIEGIVAARQRDLIEFLKKMNTGSLKKAKSIWNLTSAHLSNRKVDEYFNDVINAGIIQLFLNGREWQFRFIKELEMYSTLGAGKKLEKRFNVNTGRNEMMAEEEPPEELEMSSSTPFMDSVEKERKEVDETRAKIGLPPFQQKKKSRWER